MNMRIIYTAVLLLIIGAEWLAAENPTDVEIRIDCDVSNAIRYITNGHCKTP